jgi:hypothetical protein
VRYFGQTTWETICLCYLTNEAQGAGIIPDYAMEGKLKMLDKSNKPGAGTPWVPLTPAERAAQAAKAKAEAEAKVAARKSAMQYLEPKDAAEAAEQIKRLNEALKQEQANLSNRINIDETRANIKSIRDNLTRAKEAGAKFGLS